MPRKSRTASSGSESIVVSLFRAFVRLTNHARTQLADGRQWQGSDHPMVAKICFCGEVCV